MPNISISETDFEAVSCAARDAQDAGDTEQANALDKLARKINAALSQQTVISAFGGTTFGPRTGKARWQDMPTTLKQERHDG